MTIEEAVRVITFSTENPASASTDELRVATELAIDALLSVQRIRGTCGACLPYLLRGETSADIELK